MHEAEQLRQRAISNPRRLVSEIDDIDRLLGSNDAIAQRHATEAARKVAYVKPEEMRRCKRSLIEVVRNGRTTSAQTSACFALGYIGRVDEQAQELLTEPRCDRSNTAVRRAAARARNSIARQAPPGQSSNSRSNTGTASDTDVYEHTSSDTSVYDRGSTSSEDTQVFDPGSKPSAEVPNFCANCGRDLRDQTSPNFCPDCGTDVS